MVCSAAETTAPEQTVQQTLGEKLYSYPVVSATYEKTAELYNSAKEASPYVKVALEKAEETAALVSQKAAPLVEPVMEKAQEKIDLQYYSDAGVNKLNELENSYPVMKETPEAIINSSKAYVDETVEGGKAYVNQTIEGGKTKFVETQEALKAKVSEAYATVGTVGQSAQQKLNEQNEALKASLEKIQGMIKANLLDTQAKAAEGANILKENVNIAKAAEATKQLAENIKASVASAKDSAAPEFEAKLQLVSDKLNEFYGRVNAEESEKDEAYVRHARTLMALGKESIQLLESAKVSLTQYTSEVMSKLTN